MSDLISELDPLLNPRSIAVVGASSNPGRVGGRPIAYLLSHGYKGKIYPVNPKYKEVQGLESFPDLSAIKGEVDLVISAVPGKMIFDVFDQCEKKGAKSIVVFASGFAELGGEGVERQRRITEFAKRTGIRICGPNSPGFVNPAMNVVATFSIFGEVIHKFKPGNVGIVSQSGGLLGSLINRVMDTGAGISFAVSTGNEGDLTVTDFMEYLVDDPKTTVITAFIEGIRNPDQFLSVLDRALEKGKPVVILKSGRSEKGSKAVASHTGAIAGSSETFHGIFRQKGVIPVYDIDDLSAVTAFFAFSSAPEKKGVGVISTSGGAAGILADLSDEEGLDLSPLSDATVEKLSEILPVYAVSPVNPMDMTGQAYNEPEVVEKLYDIYITEENFGSTVFLLSTLGGHMTTLFAEGILAAAKKTRKPVVVLLLAGTMSDEINEIFKKNGITVFRTAANCIRTLRAAYEYNQTRLRFQSKPEDNLVDPDAKKEVEALIAGRSGALSERESLAVLACCGIPTVKSRLAPTTEEAVTIAGEMGFPVVLKIESPQISHKTDAGGVEVGIKTESELKEAFERIVSNAKAYNPKAEISGVLVQEMADMDGRELLMGVNRDAQFGPQIVFGLGGVLVELLKDISIRLAPLSRPEAEAMVKEIANYRILEEFRGMGRADIDAVVDTLVRLSWLAADFSSKIKEIDINPILALEEGKGVCAVDALVVLA